MNRTNYESVITKIFLILCLISLVFISTVSAETIFLKDGTSVKGSVVSSDDKNIIIDTEFGRLIIVKDKVLSIEYKEREDEKFKTGIVVKEIELNRLESRKQGDVIGIALVYGLTIVGDIAVGGDLTLIGSVIPVVGPFIAITEEGAKGYEAVLILSGIIQSAFFIDYLSTSHKISSLKESYKVSIYPMPNNIGLIVSFKF